MLLWAFLLSLTALAGVLIGLFIGAFCDEKKSAVIVLQVCLIILNAGAGFLVNTGEGANFIIKFLSWISPVKYATEILMRRILKDEP